MEWVAPLHSINGYGLFRVMTTKRLEIVIEGSQDAETWVEYQFLWKPGDIDGRPMFVAPHQPRLDWQMWFAALNPRRNEQWLMRMVERLLKGCPQVLDLLAENENPFPDKPPKFIRLVYYDYYFSGPEEPTAWWTRESLGELTLPLSLREVRE